MASGRLATDAYVRRTATVVRVRSIEGPRAVRGGGRHVLVPAAGAVLWARMQRPVASQPTARTLRTATHTSRQRDVSAPPTGAAVLWAQPRRGRGGPARRVRRGRRIVKGRLGKPIEPVTKPNSSTTLTASSWTKPPSRAPRPRPRSWNPRSNGSASAPAGPPEAVARGPTSLRPPAAAISQRHRWARAPSSPVLGTPVGWAFVKAHGAVHRNHHQRPFGLSRDSAAGQVIRASISWAVAGPWRARRIVGHARRGLPWRCEVRPDA